MAKRAKITEESASNMLKGDALDRFTGGSEKPSKPSKQRASKTAKQQAAEPEADRVKATFYLDLDHIVALEEFRLKELKKTGKKVDKSELVRRAIDLLIKQ